MKKVTFKEAIEISRLFVATIHEVKFNKTSVKNIKSIAFLLDHKGETLKEMKEHIFEKFPNMSKSLLDVKIAKVIRELKKEGLIEKTNAEDDKRCVIVTVTPKGISIFKEFDKLAKAKWEGVTNV